MDDKSQLHELVREILSLIGDADNSTYLRMVQPPLLERNDMFWLIEELNKTSEETLQRAYAKLIWRLADTESASHMSAVLDGCEKSSILAAEFGNPQTAVELDSPEADLQRKRYQEAEEFSTRSNKSRRQPLDPPPAERLEQQLQAVESDEPLNWWWMARLLELEDDQYLRHAFETDIRALHGWQVSSRETRERIQRTAISYLAALPRIEEFGQIGPNNDLRYIAGYRALRLLLNESPQMLDELLPEVWGDWAPTVLGMRMQGEVSASNDQDSLSQIVYRMNSASTLQALRDLIFERNANDDDYIQGLEWTRECWDEQLEDTLLSLAQESNLKKASLQVVLRELVRANATGVEQITERIISERDDGDDQWDRATVAGAILLEHAPDAGWSVIWPVLKTDRSFGKSVIESVTTWLDVRGGLDLQSRLSEDQLADFYEWLETQYPEDQDPGYDSGRTLTAITTRHEVADLRKSIVRQLRNKGTFEAKRQIDRLSQLFPDNLSLKLTAIDAGRLARQVTWTPPTPDEILALARDQRVRLVQSGEQLLDAGEEVLAKLQIDLHGENPRVRGLWNEFEGKYRPKDEEDMSDFLKNYLDDHLADRAIVFGREVQIRRPSPGASGENTDVHINAISSLIEVTVLRGSPQSPRSKVVGIVTYSRR